MSEPSISRLKAAAITRLIYQSVPHMAPAANAAFLEIWSSKVALDVLELIELQHNALGRARPAERRYAILRTLNPVEFAELCQKSLMGRSFDDLVDELVAERLEEE